MRTALLIAVAIGLVAGCGNRTVPSTPDCETANWSSSNIQITRINFDGEPEDWFELYNPTSQRIDLSDFYFSDDLKRPRRARFPQGTAIEPNQHLRIEVDRETYGFGLGSTEELVISTPDASTIDYVDWNRSPSPLAAASCTTRS